MTLITLILSLVTNLLYAKSIKVYCQPLDSSVANFTLVASLELDENSSDDNVVTEALVSLRENYIESTSRFIPSKGRYRQLDQQKAYSYLFPTGNNQHVLHLILKINAESQVSEIETTTKTYTSNCTTTN